LPDGGVLALAAPAFAQDAAKGKQVYESASPKCKMCHSIAGEGNAKGADFDYATPLTGTIATRVTTPGVLDVHIQDRRDFAGKGGKPKVLMKLTVKRQRDGSSPEEDVDRPHGTRPLL
jgi:hypothetical protein